MSAFSVVETLKRGVTELLFNIEKSHFEIFKEERTEFLSKKY